jgi:hypothetical protein
MDRTGIHQSERQSRGKVKDCKPLCPNRQATSSPLEPPSENGLLPEKNEATIHRLTSKALFLHSAVRELNIKAAQPQSSVSSATISYLIAFKGLVPQEHFDSLYINAPLTPSEAPAAPDVRRAVQHMLAMTPDDLTILFSTITRAQAYISNAKRLVSFPKGSRKRKAPDHTKPEGASREELASHHQKNTHTCLPKEQEQHCSQQQTYTYGPKGIPHPIPTRHSTSAVSPLMAPPRLSSNRSDFKAAGNTVCAQMMAGQGYHLEIATTRAEDDSRGGHIRHTLGPSTCCKK